jgi:hypothetical protein
MRREVLQWEHSCGLINIEGIVPNIYRTNSNIYTDHFFKWFMIEQS